MEIKDVFRDEQNFPTNSGFIGSKKCKSSLLSTDAISILPNNKHVSVPTNVQKPRSVNTKRYDHKKVRRGLKKRKKSFDI